MTGVDDPYEVPENPDVVVGSEALDQAVARVISALR
jgi:adenylylsulfate kinase-like enzyme